MTVAPTKASKETSSPDAPERKRKLPDVAKLAAELREAQVDREVELAYNLLDAATEFYFAARESSGAPDYRRLASDEECREWFAQAAQLSHSAGECFHRASANLSSRSDPWGERPF